MPKVLIKSLVAAISSIREAAAELQKEEQDNVSTGNPFDANLKGPIKDHDGSTQQNFNLSGLSDLVEEK